MLIIIVHIVEIMTIVHLVVSFIITNKTENLRHFNDLPM